MVKRIGLLLAVAALLVPGYQEAARYKFINRVGKDVGVAVTVADLPVIVGLIIGANGLISPLESRRGAGMFKKEAGGWYEFVHGYARFRYARVGAADEGLWVELREADNSPTSDERDPLFRGIVTIRRGEEGLKALLIDSVQKVATVDAVQKVAKGKPIDTAQYAALWAFLLDSVKKAVKDKSVDAAQFLDAIITSFEEKMGEQKGDNAALKYKLLEMLRHAAAGVNRMK